MKKTSLIEKLHPYDIGDKKVRLGPNEDGGYVLNETILDNSMALVTYGVGNDMRFEEHFTRQYNKPSYLFDHTIGRETGWDIGANLHFFNEGLGFSPQCKDFIEHYETLKFTQDVILKIDVEGAEYNYFANTSVETISKYTSGVLLEVHWLSDAHHREKFEMILDELQKHFTVTHVHGNSWGVVVDYEGFMFPETIEVTLVNNKHIKSKTLDTSKYPVPGLDVSNRPNYPDVDLAFLTA